MSEKKISPWLSGIVDTLVGANLIKQSDIAHRNRLVVVLMDSAFETACRAYLRYKAKMTLSDAHRQRDTLIKTVKDKLKVIDSDVWDNIDYYYKGIRCDFYHDSAGKTITDSALSEYMETVEFIINTAFDTRIMEFVGQELIRVQSATLAAQNNPSTVNHIQLDKISGTLNKVLIAVSRISPQNVTTVNDFFKKEGSTLRLKARELSNILSVNSGSKKFFYYNKELRRWELSTTGHSRLEEILKENKYDR